MFGYSRKGIIFMPSHTSSDWKVIAEQVVKETNPQKLIILIEQLNDALAERSKPSSNVAPKCSTSAAFLISPATCHLFAA